MNAYTIILGLGSFAASALVNKFLLIYLRRKNIMDLPNERSSHTIPTPRGGGLGIVAATVLFVCIHCVIMHDIKFFIIVMSALAMAMVGLIDDLKKGASTGLRFGIQLVCASLLVWFLDPIYILPMPLPWNISLGYFGIVISIVWLVGITNIFNFLDGIDGYAGTQGLIAGLMLVLLGWGTEIAFVGLVVAMACAGFLLFNWHPAKIFMGDVGSSFLGFLFASMPFYLSDANNLFLRREMFFGVAILTWFFLTDGVFTIFRRLIKREKIWKAHRSHLYQRLVITGMSHSEVVLTVCFFYAILFAVLLFYAAQPFRSFVQWPVLFWGVGLFLIYLSYTLIRENQVKRTHKVPEEQNIL